MENHFNFGPGPKNNFSVLSVLKKSKIFWEKINWMIKKENLFYESNLLRLNSNKSI